MYRPQRFHIFKRMLEVVFSSTCDSASITSIVSKSLSSIDETEKSLGEGSRVTFGQEFPGEEWGVSRCAAVTQQTVLL
jgi:hypothetical protein